MIFSPFSSWQILCILWILSNIFSTGDGIRIVTAMTPNGSLDPLKIHCETRQPSQLPECPGNAKRMASFGDFYIKIHPKSSKILETFAAKKFQVGGVFLVDFLVLPKNVEFFQLVVQTSLRVFRSWPRSSITSTFESWRVRSYTTSTSSNSSNSSSSS